MGQFAQGRSRALLVLALGYLFDGLIIIPHALTFPGLFTPTGLLGAGSQSTAWLYMFWHSRFPLFVIGYAVLQRREHAGPGRLNAEVSEPIVAQARTVAQLRHAQKMEAIGNLTGGMAHDFNNMLAIIIGHLDLLSARKNASQDEVELVQSALDAALRGAGLTRRLLAFARRQPLQPERVALNDLITETVRLLSRMLGEQIEVETDLRPGLWPVVVDPAQLASCLTNLANNARDAMPRGGRLRIATCNAHLDADYAAQHVDLAPGDYAMIEIADSGHGMAPDVLSRIFEPFFTTKEIGKGTGLGLSMVFGFIKQSGGHINVYSEQGMGTTFRLYLPRAKASAAAAAPPKAVQPARGRGERVLVVEDNAALKGVVARQLAELGYRVLDANNAASALAVLEREIVDLLFTDVIMPGGTNGIELARIVSGRWPMLRVVFTSGFPETNLNSNFGPVPGSRLLTKPYRKEDLARALREALDAEVPAGRAAGVDATTQIAGSPIA